MQKYYVCHQNIMQSKDKSKTISLTKHFFKRWAEQILETEDINQATQSKYILFSVKTIIVEGGA